jgi:hypothetical protein
MRSAFETVAKMVSILANLEVPITQEVLQTMQQLAARLVPRMRASE